MSKPVILKEMIPEMTAAAKCGTWKMPQNMLGMGYLDRVKRHVPVLVQDSCPCCGSKPCGTAVREFFLMCLTCGAQWDPRWRVRGTVDVSQLTADLRKVVWNDAYSAGRSAGYDVGYENGRLKRAETAAEDDDD